MTASVQLLVYRFGLGAEFEGRLVGALERTESGGALRVLDILFVGRDPATGEVFAIDLHGSGAGGMVAPLLGFRLDVAERRRATRRTLERPDGPGELIRELGETLEPGEALAAVLVGHEWARALDDAIERTGGTALANAFVGPTTLTALAPDLLAAAGRGSARVR
jgi:hypothetical protein